MQPVRSSLCFVMVWYQSILSLFLTHWSRDKMAAISQTIFSNAFFRMKMFVPWVRIGNIPALVQITAWYRPGTSHYLNQWWLVYWRIYASLCFNVLTIRHWPRHTWWRNQMETFVTLLAFVNGILGSPMDSHHKGQWRGALIFSLICAWINGWVSNRDDGDLKRHRARYGVTELNLAIFSLPIK